MEFACQLDSPLGPIVLTEEDGALRSLRFVGQRYFPDSLPPFVDPAARPVFEETADWLARYFSGHEPDFTPPLALQGTPFRLAVWELLREIPCGETRSYGELARILEARLGRPVSARAVGGAVGHNPISLLIPCHRVIGADGSLTGYAGGLSRKRSLLELEQGRPL